MNGFTTTHPSDITEGDIKKARRMMRNGYSMRDTAAHMKIHPASALDRALFAHIADFHDAPTEDHP